MKQLFGADPRATASRMPIILLGRGIADRIAYDTSAIGL
jgi:hypothetical protein